MTKRKPYTADMVAKYLKENHGIQISAGRVRVLAKDGRFPGVQKIDPDKPRSQWLFTKQSILNYIKSR